MSWKIETILWQKSEILVCGLHKQKRLSKNAGPGRLDEYHERNTKGNRHPRSKKFDAKIT